MIPFPLGKDEAFGRGRWANMSAGLIDREHIHPRIGLVAWQRHVAVSWRLPVRASGLWDAQCTQAVLEIQAELGLPRSGVLDSETWEASCSKSRHGR